MNKATKGAIAAGAAGILLAGGAGTFALWSESGSINAGAVSTGKLDLAVGTGEWSEATAGSISDIADFKMVPGDTLTYTTTVTITAEGDNLSGTLGVNDSTLADVGNIAVSMSTTPGFNPGLTDAGNGSFTFEAAGTYTIDVEVTVAFDAAAEQQETATVDPSAISLTLEQNRA